MQRVELFDQLINHHLLQLSVLFEIITTSNMEAIGMYLQP